MHNEPVPETKKVRDLLARVKASELASAKQQMKATAALAASFQEAANFTKKGVEILPAVFKVEKKLHL